MALQTALTSTEARSVDGIVQEIPKTAGEKIRRMWPNIDASYADSLVSSADAVGTSGIITNPVIDGQTYTGSYAVGKVYYTDPDDRRAVNIIQELTKVTALTSDYTSLTNQSPLITKSNTILRRFALAEGEEDSVTYVYPYVKSDSTSRGYFFAFSDANLESALGLGTGSYITRQIVEQDDGTAVCAITCKTAVWTAWSSNPAANITTYSQCGDNNERETITKEWMGVAKADLSDAMTELRAGTGHVTASTGYIIMEARASDNQDGSISLTQVQIKQLKGVATTAADEKWVLNPHSITSMLCGMTQQTIIYENFIKTDIESASVGNPANYVPITNAGVISNIPEVMSNGLWRRTIITQAVSYQNTTGATKIQVGEGNVPGTWSTQTSGYPTAGNDAYGQNKTEYARGIPINSLASVIAAATPDDDNHGLVSISGHEMANGEGAYTKHQKIWFAHTGAANTAMTIDLGVATSNQKADQRYVWYSVAHDSIEGVWGNALTYGVTGDYVHKRRWKVPHPDGSADIYCEVWNPAYGDDVYDNTKDYYIYLNANSGHVVEIQEYRVGSLSDAESFCQGGATAYTLYAHKAVGYWVTLASELGITLVDANFKVVGADSGNFTHLRNIGPYKYHAVRVIKYSAQIGS